MRAAEEEITSFNNILIENIESSVYFMLDPPDSVDSLSATNNENTILTF